MAKLLFVILLVYTLVMGVVRCSGGQEPIDALPVNSYPQELAPLPERSLLVEPPQGAHEQKCLPLGSVLVSRNLDERENTTPGYWNHLAIYVGDGWVVESQECEGVIRTPLKEYIKRDYNYGFLYPIDEEAGKRAAAYAETLVGRPYRKVLYPRHPSAGMNCVHVVRYAWSHALDVRIPAWRWRPDRILWYDCIFKDKL